MCESNDIKQPEGLAMPRKIETGIPIAECSDIEFLRDTVNKLWQIIDDIDSYSDMAKSDDKFYRNRVERRQAQRWTETDIVSDGYDLYRKPV